MGLFGTKIDGLFTEGATGGGGGGNVTSITATAPIVASTNPITSTGTLSIPVATASANGYLSSANWTTFNSKLSGTGTAGVIPKFTGSGATIGDGLLIDNTTYVQVGSFTLGANVASTGSVNFATQGVIGSSLGLYLNNPANPYAKQGVFQASNRIDFFAGGNPIATMNLATNGYLQITRGFTNNAGSQLAITGGINVSANNSSNYTFVNVTPTINQSSGGFTGTGQIRGFYYAPPSVNIVGGTVHNAWENTSGNIVFGNLTGANTEVLMINTSGTLVKQSQQNTFNLYNGSTAEGLVIDYTVPSYILGNVASSRASLRIITDRIEGYYGNAVNGLSIDYSNAIYKFGEIDGTVQTPIFLQIDGSSSKAEIIYNGYSDGLLLDYTNKLFKFGEYAGNFNGTSIIIDDTANKITLDADGGGSGNIEIATGSTTGVFTLNTESIVLDGASLTSASAGSVSTYLVVTVNSVQYKIELYTI